MVLLPGLDGTGILFRPLLAALAGEANPQVIAYPQDRELGLDQLAEHVAGRLPPGEPLLVAESFSGLVALTLLARGLARFRAVVFVAAFAEPPRPFLLRMTPLFKRAAPLVTSAPAFLLRQYCLGPDATAADLKLFREAVSGVSPAVLAQRMAIVATRHSFGRGTFDVPCLYLQASQDRLVPAASIRWFEQRFATCRVERMPGPHFLLQARPVECARKLEREAG